MTKGVGPSIGIDLGMTYSCVGVWQHVDIMGNDQATMATAPRPPTSPPPATPPGTRSQRTPPTPSSVRASI
uniref:Uncharacterized protein n=1 Tax=Aegilops tauschii subsp. strangulata TaxID=200361 RepID=A0A453JID9_AEGTS